MNNYTPAGHSPVPGTHPPATARPASGRRRAAPLQGRRRADPSADGSSRHRGRKAALAVIASGVALTASLASAHATTPRASTLPPTQAAGTSTRAEAVPVAAAAGAQLNFVRTEVTTSPRPAAPPPQETFAAETAFPATAAAPPQAPVKAAPPQAPVKAAPAPGARLSSPVLNPVTNSPFGYRTNPLTGSAGELHTGQDFAAGCGTEVFSAGKGTVIEAGFSPYGGGNRIVIDHGNGLQTTYNHLETIGVQINQAVETGTRIGIAGSTGNSTGCHLHFEVVVNGQTVDPSAWL